MKTLRQQLNYSVNDVTLILGSQQTRGVEPTTLEESEETHHQS